MLRCISVILIVGFLSVSSAKDLPSYFPKCKRDDPKLGECLVSATKTLKPYLKNGIPELSLPSLNPFFLPLIEYGVGNAVLNYSSTFTNISVRGLDDYSFKKFDYDPETYTVNGVITFKKLLIYAEGTAVGKILITPIRGKGIIKVLIDATTATFVLYGELKEQNGLIYHKLKDANITLHFRAQQTRFEDIKLFDNGELSALISRILNENADQIINEAIPPVELRMRDFLMDLWEKTFGQVPYDQLFPLSS